MFDFLTPTGILSAFLSNAWTAVSPLALVGGLSGLGLILVALLGLAMMPGVVAAFVPNWLKHGLILIGAGLLALSAAYQAGQAKGTHDAFAKDAKRAIAAEAARADAAERIKDQIAVQATKDLAAEKAANRKLKDLNDALAKVPGHDRVCVDRDLSRRLRDL